MINACHKIEDCGTTSKKTCNFEEGVANHLGPEPCVNTREGEGEASAGESTGQPLSRERNHILGADRSRASGTTQRLD